MSLRAMFLRLSILTAVSAALVLARAPAPATARRLFYGPGIENFDMELSKTLPITESKSFDIRVEAFNVFNHAQFYGPSAVDGRIDDPNFGSVVSAAAPRLIQAAIKFHF